MSDKSNNLNDVVFTSDKDIIDWLLDKLLNQISKLDYELNKQREKKPVQLIKAKTQQANSLNSLIKTTLLLLNNRQLSTINENISKLKNNTFNDSEDVELYFSDELRSKLEEIKELE